MKVISCFDGISGAMQALKNLNIKVDEYHAFEIDKYASQISQKDHPEIIQRGSIENWNEPCDWDFVVDLPNNPNLIIGGSPCQDLSIAGNRKGLDGARSGLFFYMAEMIRILKPKYFLVENVASMAKDQQAIFTEILGVDPILIDSGDLTSQRRLRLYWTNIKVSQPAVKNIYLKHIIEDLDKDFKKGVYKKFDKKPNTTMTKSGLLIVGMATDIKGKDSQKRIYSIEGKSPTITTMQGGNRHVKIAINDFEYRGLTPLEHERLQGYSDGYSSVVSNTQRYKGLGNSFTVQVIEHILKGMKKAK